MYDIKKINKEIDKLKIPKQFRNRIVNLEKFLSNDITMQLSIRKDAGKTTQALILALVFYKLYNFKTEYVRSDADQITRGNIETLFDVIIKNYYIEKLFPQYNTVVYKVQQRKFYFAHQCINDAGETEIDLTASDYFMHVACNENWMKYKSSYNSTDSALMIYDEFMDSKRPTQNQMIELQNNISTMLRGKEEFSHVLMLGNNVDEYSFWWSEFCIENEITGLSFGGYIEKKTDLGTTFYCEMLQVSEEQKETIRKKLIRFSGFDTPKMGAFNGIEPWQGSSHPHIPKLEMLDAEPYYNNVWVRFRNRYARINIYEDKKGFGWYIFMHYSNAPKYEDGVILTDEPQHFNEVYGVGEFTNYEDIKDTLHKICNIIREKRVYYESNSVGDFFTAYLKETRINR